MVGYCHRCGGELAAVGGESTFCPHCGAPQLRVLEENIAENDFGENSGASTKALPPPHPGRVVWGAAVGYAAAVAGVAAGLMVGVLWVPAAFPLAWLWTVCGGVVVLGLYQRRHPASVVNAGTGARIGLVYGLMAVTALALVIAVGGLVARFRLHTMGALDAWLTNAMRQAVDQQMQQAGSAAITADQLRTFYSPEVRAGLALFLLTVGAVLLTAFSTLGGAVGGMMRMRRQQGAR